MLDDRSVQTTLLALVVGTLFLQEDKGLQAGADGAPNVTASLTSANNFLVSGGRPGAWLVMRSPLASWSRLWRWRAGSTGRQRAIVGLR